jgi:hypothetical protein
MITKGSIPTIVHQPISRTTACFHLSLRRMENNIIPQEITAHRSTGKRNTSTDAKEMARNSNWFDGLISDGMKFSLIF